MAPPERVTVAVGVSPPAISGAVKLTFGAAAVDLCFVACGRLDAYFEEHLHTWDLVAGQVIATEAGAIVTDYVGETVRPEQVLASSPGVHKDLIRLIATSGNTAP